MSLDILTTLFSYVDTSNASASSSSSSLTCLDGIEHSTLFQWLMLPSMIEILILSFTITRISLKCDGKCWNRPAIVTPMDIFDKGNRYSYMAAFGSVAYLASEVVLNSKYVIDYSGPIAYRIFVILLSVICYGVAYLPIFAALYLLSIPSLILGSLHVWMFTAIETYKCFQCVYVYSVGDTFLTITRDFPKLFALYFLSVSMPIRLGKVIWRRVKVLESSKAKSYESKLEEIRTSRIGRHVTKNFIPPKPKFKKPRPGIKGKIKDIALPIIKTWIYYRNPEFQYSVRLLAAVAVCFMLIYKLTFELLYIFIVLTNALTDGLLAVLDAIGYTEQPNEDPNITSARTLVYIVYYFVDAFRGCSITAVVVESLLASLNLLHVMSSYRKNLLAVHKGINNHIPEKSVKSNASIVVGSLRYIGYQIGFSLWAYVIQFVLILLVLCAIAFIVTLYKAGQGEIITNLIRTFWSLPVAAIAINLAQLFITKFLFLQEKGDVLGLENRRGFFLFAYFMFYYNIFIGIIGCLLRMIKAIIIGSLFLGRLDHSTLPHRFQLFDPGFDAYVGFMHLENMQMHPVLLSFVALLNIKVPPRERVPDEEQQKTIERKSLDESRRCTVRARWQLAYTLQNNPELRILRKKYLADVNKRLQIEAEIRKEQKLAKKNKTSNNAVKPVDENYAVKSIEMSEMAEVFELFFYYISNNTLSSSTTQLRTSCGKTIIPQDTFFQWLMLPAIVEIAILAFTVTRNSAKYRDRCWNRPGIVIPMDIFDKRDRYSFMAAFGSVAYLTSEVVLNAKLVISESVAPSYRIFVILLSVLCYGIAYFPIFAALALHTIPSLLIGSAHIWMFTAIGFVQSCECFSDYDAAGIALSLARDLPKLVALCFLSVSLPVRFVLEVRKKLKVMDGSKAGQYEDELEKIRTSPMGCHVAKNFIPPKPKIKKPRPGIKGKIKDMALPLLKKWIYYRNPEFKYSTRLLSAIVICFMLIYKLTLELMYLSMTVTASWLDSLLQIYYLVGTEATPGEDPYLTDVRTLLDVIYYFVEAIQVCAMVAASLVFVMAVVNLLHVMSSYRKYLLALHKGINDHIPPRSDKSNPSIMIGALRYMGYQIGFCLWAYLIQWSLVLLVLIFLATIVILFKAGLGSVFINLLANTWPVPVAALVLNILQFLVSKFVFLQHRGEHLAIENRRGFFVFAYFMFYYNIFIGLVGCLLRMIKAIIIGTLFLGRLDHSTLPRRFQLLDPGFDAYVGFLHLENAQVHPVLLTFVALLNLKVPARKKVVDEDQEKSLGRKTLEESRRCLVKARWNLAVMLSINPGLQVLRKRYLADVNKRLEIEAAYRKEQKQAKKAKNGKISVAPISLEEAV